MKNDLISRQAAIDLFPNDALEWDTIGGYIAPHFARRMIEELPSAQLQRKRGKWKMDLKRHVFICPICGAWHVFNCNYCSNCGADMREVDDERPD
jgi:hypothetical protein